MTKSSMKFNLQDLFFFLLLLVVTVGFFSILQPFIDDIFITIILAVLFKKPFAFFLKKSKGNKQRASVFTIVMVVFVIIIPLSVIVVMLTKELGHGYSLLTNNWSEIKNYIYLIPEKLSSNPNLKNIIDRIDWEKLANSATNFVSTATQLILSLVQKTFINVGFMIFHLFITLFLLYYLFIDKDKLVERLHYLIPLKDSEENELFEKLVQVTDAIVFNTLMIGFIEGSYGGILLAILGIPSPFFWGMLMTFLSIIPLIGANSVLVPMAVYQIIIGNVATGIIILTVGAGAVIINQNLIKPRLDGNKSGMHPAIMFLASMGGLITFGVIGFISGPIITGLFLVTWSFFGKRYKQSLKSFNK
jgi:predicted PurR-regulated permease PerM